MLWQIYLLLLDGGRVARDRLERILREPERGDMNISKAIYAALAVGLGVLIVAAITAVVQNNLAKLR